MQSRQQPRYIEKYHRFAKALNLNRDRSLATCFVAQKEVESHALEVHGSTQTSDQVFCLQSFRTEALRPLSKLIDLSYTLAIVLGRIVCFESELAWVTSTLHNEYICPHILQRALGE